MLQVNSGPIGVEATGIIARLVTIYFDRIFITRLTMLGLTIYLYLRLIDDGNLAVSRVPRTKMLDIKSMKLVDCNEDNHQDEEDDQRTMNVIRQIADSVISMISWTSDTMSQNESK